MLHFITDFADQAVMLPVMVTVVLIMAVYGWWRGALVWALTAVAMLAVMLLLKIAGLYYAAIERTTIISPSGHVAAACMVYGGLLVLLGQRYFRRFPVLMLVPLSGIGIAVACTRVALHTHTLFEVVTGGVVGCAAGFALGRACGPVPQRLWFYLLPVVACVAALFHGAHLGIEGAIRCMFMPRRISA
ncbi:phosphatase PAP2 family protein [Komagataeibacter sp. AV436]|uniref:Phosphatase PAP2 family protein n=2 Tax=Komagataeibacter melomenusus TaxID=2766578 RepID=A0ABX2AAQ5_9PROT|nr:phosphatase PAP2 family protein [Komagataeibacter melomenusus]NPC65441.1 phosphatase PAP2 family protein [Komagataeibacter melomenusus]